MKLIPAAIVTAIALPAGAADYTPPPVGATLTFVEDGEDGRYAYAETILAADETGYISLFVNAETDFLLRVSYGMAAAPCGSGPHPFADDVAALFPLAVGNFTESGAFRVTGAGEPLEIGGETFETWLVEEVTEHGYSYTMRFAPGFGTVVDGLTGIETAELDLAAMGISEDDIAACR